MPNINEGKPWSQQDEEDLRLAVPGEPVAPSSQKNRPGRDIPGPTTNKEAKNPLFDCVVIAALANGLDPANKSRLDHLHCSIHLCLRASI
jgi:hypothetical protein